MRPSDPVVRFLWHCGAWLCPKCFSRDLANPSDGLVLLRSGKTTLPGHVRAWCQWCRHVSQPIPVSELHRDSSLLPPDGAQSRPLLSLVRGGVTDA